VTVCYQTKGITGRTKLGMTVFIHLASAKAGDSDVVVIEDITSWQHPVKKVFAKYGIKIDKVELFRQT
jgi:hypothetical protein